MSEFQEDELFYPLMVKLAGCLEREVAAAGLPGLCVTSVLPGPEAVVDCGCEDEECAGQGWVLTPRVFPTTSFPEMSAVATCATMLAIELQVGVTRCVPSFSEAERGEAPSMASMLAAARLQMADMRAMKRAIECCMADVDTDYVLGAFETIPNSGWCGGGAWTVTVMQEF